MLDFTHLILNISKHNTVIEVTVFMCSIHILPELLQPLLHPFKWITFTLYISAMKFGTDESLVNRIYFHPLHTYFFFVIPDLRYTLNTLTITCFFSVFLYHPTGLLWLVFGQVWPAALSWQPFHRSASIPRSLLCILNQGGSLWLCKQSRNVSKHLYRGVVIFSEEW